MSCHDIIKSENMWTLSKMRNTFPSPTGCLLGYFCGFPSPFRWCIGNQGHYYKIKTIVIKDAL